MGKSPRKAAFIFGLLFLLGAATASAQIHQRLSAQNASGTKANHGNVIIIDNIDMD
ncbi:MAG: hypothetical protein U0176_25505 [Bacteroidia bacterium]